MPPTAPHSPSAGSAHTPPPESPSGQRSTGTRRRGVRNFLHGSGLIDDIRDEVDRFTGVDGGNEAGRTHTVASTGTFAYNKVATRASIFIAVVVTGAILGWTLNPPWLSPMVFLGLLIGICILGVYAGRQLIRNNPLGLPIAFVYCLIQGGVLGWVSHVYDSMFGGVVAQAVLATITTAFAVIWYSGTPLGRKTGRATGIFATAVLGYLAFIVVDIFLGLAGVGGGWGIHGLGAIGLAVCLFGCVFAAWSLNVDVTAARDLHGRPAPDTLTWASAFAITVSLIWLYLELLRLLAVARR